MPLSNPTGLDRAPLAKDSTGGSPEDAPSVLELRMMGVPWGGKFTPGVSYEACFGRHPLAGNPRQVNEYGQSPPQLLSLHNVALETLSGLSERIQFHANHPQSTWDTRGRDHMSSLTMTMALTIIITILHPLRTTPNIELPLIAVSLTRTKNHLGHLSIVDWRMTFPISTISNSALPPLAVSPGPRTPSQTRHYLSGHARRPTYTSHQEYPRRDHYEHSAPQNYKEDDLYESLNYHPSPQGSLGHLRENDPRHVSPRDDIQRLRAELDDSLARDASLLVPQQTPERPLSRSWDPALSVSARHSPYPRSFQPSPMASDLAAHGVRPPLVRPRSRSSIPHRVMPMEGSALHTTPLGRPRSRSSFAYPAVSGLRSPYPSGRRSPGLGLSSNTTWSSSPAVKMIPSVTRVETTLMGGLAHQPTGASLRRQNSLSDKVHEINELNNYIRDSELAQQRERALVDRATSDLAGQSLADEVRRSEVNRERELALANQQVTQLAQHSLAKDL
ncbi:hypothetical protein PCASD_01462 [Puccinia coronata f. sp. avenae]|uniref:Uncharacterized protein n=1 Tax=Puccinia coronata f. sp. avenae TaxID=200324 RepID=A0A2N5VKK8_9BASI|nr:hypothetical protein PCASD_01462 [Puccinia coronata f. sp. avenae]